MNTKENTVIFHAVVQICTSRSSWILSTVIDFELYGNALTDIRQYTVIVRSSMHDFLNTFRSEDKRYIKLINITRQNHNMAIDRLNDIYTRFYNLMGVTRNHDSNSGIISLRSLPPFWELGTASNSDRKAMKNVY